MLFSEIEFHFRQNLQQVLQQVYLFLLFQKDKNYSKKTQEIKEK